MHQDLSVVKTLGSHHGSTNLAESNPVSPTGSDEPEGGRDAVTYGPFLDHKSRTVKMGFRKRPANFQLLSDDDSLFGSPDL